MIRLAMGLARQSGTRAADAHLLQLKTNFVVTLAWGLLTRLVLRPERHKLASRVIATTKLHYAQPAEAKTNDTV